MVTTADTTTADTTTRAAWGRALAATCDDVTSMVLSRLGVGTGCKVLVAGPGTARIARWLAAAGSDVVTTDPEAVPGPGAVEVARRRIGIDPLPARSFDLVLVRLCLARAADPVAVLSDVAGSLRPGGRLVAEEADWASLVPARPDPSVEQVRDACIASISARGGRTDAGRLLGGWLRSAGLEQVDTLGRVTTLRSSSAAAALIQHTLELMRADLLTAGAVAPEDVDASIASLQDPRFDALTHVMVSSWGHVGSAGHGPNGPGRGKS